MNSHNVNEAISVSIPVPGYGEHWTIGLTDCKTSAALTLTAATTPTITVASNQTIITWAASDSAALMILGGRQIPYWVSNCEFDPTSKRIGTNLCIDCYFLQTGTTNTITVTATIYVRTPGGAQKGPFTATVVVLNGATYYTRHRISFLGVIDASSNQIAPGDIIDICTLTPSAHTTDALLMAAPSIVLKRNIAFFADTERSF